MVFIYLTIHLNVTLSVTLNNTLFMLFKNEFYIQRFYILLTFFSHKSRFMTAKVQINFLSESFAPLVLIEFTQGQRRRVCANTH